jgi:hypothetical protein
MFFSHGRTVTILRGKPILDPYSHVQIDADWNNPDEIDIDGAFIAQSSTSTAITATRAQQLESKSLYCDPDSDVRTGDRIRDAGALYTIDGIPAADTNPFTGWQPVQEIPLTRYVG